jgi:hypothetical protein
MAAKAGSPAPPPPSGNDDKNIGHNSQAGPLTQEDLDDLFLVHLAQARADNETLEKAMEAVRAVRKIRTRNRNTCRTDGFPLTELDNILADELMPRSDVEEREAKRLRMRGVAGQPGGSLEPQQDLFKDSFAKREADEAYWRGHGKMIGLRGADPDITKYDVPGEFTQAWEEERREGTARLERAYLTKSRIEGTAEPEKPAEPTPPAEGAATPAGEPKPSEPGSDAGASGGSDTATSPPDTFTEATAEELEAQKTRQGIQEARQGESEPETTDGSGSAPATTSAPADPNEEPCPECGADPGEPCAPDCTSPATEPEPAGEAA